MTNAGDYLRARYAMRRDTTPIQLVVAGSPPIAGPAPVAFRDWPTAFLSLRAAGQPEDAQ